MASQCGTTSADSAKMASSRALTDESAEISVASNITGSQLVMASQKSSDQFGQMSVDGNSQTIESTSYFDDGVDFGSTTVRQEPKFVQQLTGLVGGVVSTKTGLISTGVLGASASVTAGDRLVSLSAIGQGVYESVATGNDDEKINKSNTGTNYAITTYDDANNTKASFTLNKNFVLNVNETGDDETVHLELHKLGEPDTKVLIAMVAESDGFRYNVEASKDGETMRYGHSCHHATGSVSAEMYEIDTIFEIDTKFRGVQPANIIDRLLYSLSDADNYTKNELIQSETNGFEAYVNIDVVAGVEDFTNANYFKLNQDIFEAKVLFSTANTSLLLDPHNGKAILTSSSDTDIATITIEPTILNIECERVISKSGNTKIEISSDNITYFATNGVNNSSIGQAADLIHIEANDIELIGNLNFIKVGSTLVTFDGIEDTFVIPHGMSTTPSSFSITFGDAANTNFTQSTRTIDATNITITCGNVPLVGSQTVYWQVFK